MSGREHAGSPGEIGMPGVRCLPRDSHLSGGRRGETPSPIGYAGADGGFDGSGIAPALRMRSAAHTRGAGQWAGAEAEGWHDAGRHWSASPIKPTKREATPPRPFFLHLRLRLCSAEPAGGAGAPCLAAGSAPAESPSTKQNAAVRVCCCDAPAQLAMRDSSKGDAQNSCGIGDWNCSARFAVTRGSCEQLRDKQEACP